MKQAPTDPKTIDEVSVYTKSGHVVTFMTTDIETKIDNDRLQSLTWMTHRLFGHNNLRFIDANDVVAVTNRTYKIDQEKVTVNPEMDEATPADVMREDIGEAAVKRLARECGLTEKERSLLAFSINASEVSPEDRTKALEWLCSELNTTANAMLSKVKMSLSRKMMRKLDQYKREEGNGTPHV